MHTKFYQNWLSFVEHVTKKIWCVFSVHSLVNTPCLKKLCKIVLSELRQISTNFDNFWQKDGKEAKINWRHHTTVLNADVPNC